MPTVASGSSGANANGKRPRDTIDTATAATDSASATAVASDISAHGNISHHAGHPGTHPAGYTWTKPEDAPGYAWQNRKSQEEANRAYEQGVVHKDRSIGSKCHFQLF